MLQTYIKVVIASTLMNMKTDLKLIPMEVLIKEIFSRTDACVIAYLRTEDHIDPIIHTDWTGGTFISQLGLCEYLSNMITEAFHEGLKDDI